MEDVLPALGLYVPAAPQDRHAVEDELPVLGLYVPAAQKVQDDALAALYAVPANLKLPSS